VGKPTARSGRGDEASRLGYAFEPGAPRRWGNLNPPLQLELPLVLDAAPSSAPRLDPRSRRVFVNRDLKMSRVSWVGFDMDYTLAIYHQEAMDRLSILCTAEKMVARGYPSWIRDLHYPLDFPIRGLLVDKHLGNVLKMNRFKIVRKGYHGLTELSRNQLRALYYERKIRHKSSRYHWIDTLYALSEACMYATIIDAFEKRGMSVKYGRLFTDIRECIDEAHRDGTILEPVMADPGQYIERDETLAIALHKLRSSGKHLFVLTNSRHAYTNVLMSYLLDGVLTDYPTYRHYFDAIICAAQKPRFFQERAPLLERRGEELIPFTGAFERGRIYEGGNLHDLQRALAVTGNNVLYVGDHIYGDMVRSKKDSIWRTAIIIPELDDEVSAHRACDDDMRRWAVIEARRLELEDELRTHQRRLRELTRKTNGHPIHLDVAHLKQLLAVIRKQLRALDRDARQLRRAIDRRFHPYWGSLLKEQGELSLFGHQVNEYACIYAARVSHLAAYSPNQYFRSPHNLMHHEL
jgi:5'-nucleotidase